MLRTIFALFLMATPALATPEYTLPTLFDVARVAPNDVLNIRAEPNANSEIIGTLPYNDKNIEVVEETRGWARVNKGESTGWVSSRYLDYRTDVWTDGALPQGWKCYGTEPFWTASVKDGSVNFSTPDAGTTVHPIKAVLSTGAFRDPTRAVVAEGMTISSTPQMCSDGMSDRSFGLRAQLIMQGNSPRLLSGCCSIAP